MANTDWLTSFHPECDDKSSHAGSFGWAR